MLAVLLSADEIQYSKVRWSIGMLKLGVSTGDGFDTF